MSMNHNLYPVNRVERTFALLDLTVCALWALSALGDAWNSSVYFLAILWVLVRLSFTFAMLQKERLAFIPLLLTLALGLLIAPRVLGIKHMVLFPFHLWGVDPGRPLVLTLAAACVLWLGGLPVVWYGVQLFRKKLVRTSLTPRNVIGALLCNDPRARTYSLLLLTALVSLYVGLAADAQLSRAGCILAPLFSWWLISKYCKAAFSSWWLLLVAMLLFYYAQPLSGEWRVLLLVVSLLLTAVCGFVLFRHTRRFVLSLVAVTYIGVLLPSMLIGYNPYACLDYGRYGMQTLHPFKGIYYITDGNSLGLRHRYGLLLKPEYDDIRYPAGEQAWGVVALRKNGYTSHYNLLTDSVHHPAHIDRSLQDSICQLLNNHCNSHGYQSADRLEVKVVEHDSVSRVLAHVKMHRSGSEPLYNYSSRPFITDDTLTLPSDSFATDSPKVVAGNKLHTLRYATTVDTNPLGYFRIEVGVRRHDVPHPRELVELAASVEQLLSRKAASAARGWATGR